MSDFCSLVSGESAPKMWAQHRCHHPCSTLFPRCRQERAKHPLGTFSFDSDWVMDRQIAGQLPTDRFCVSVIGYHQTELLIVCYWNTVIIHEMCAVKSPGWAFQGGVLICYMSQSLARWSLVRRECFEGLVGCRRSRSISIPIHSSSVGFFHSTIPLQFTSGIMLSILFVFVSYSTIMQHHGRYLLSGIS